MRAEKSFFLKAVSACLAVSFLAADVAAAAPLDSLRPAVSPQQLLLDQPMRFEFPAEFAMLKEIEGGTGKTFIIHIQDAHSNLSGQQNLAGTLDYLMQKYDVSLILSEGGSSDCSLTPLKKIAPAGVLKKIAKSYLTRGLISGEEYLNLVSPRPMKIVGIEDMALYMASVENYSRLAEKREEILDYIKAIRKSLDKVKAGVYPERLIAYEKKKAAAGDFEGSFDELLSLLEAQRIDLGVYPNIRRITDLKRSEEKIDFVLANAEQAALVDELLRKGGSESLREELARMAALKSAKISQFAYFQKTFDIAEKKGVSLEPYPNLRAYFGYLKAFSEINLDLVIEEVDKAENVMYFSFLVRPDQRTVRSVDRFIALLDTAYNIKMSTDEYSLFRANETDFGTVRYLAFVNRKLSDMGYFSDLVPLKPLLEDGRSALDAFYSSVEKRDFAFVENSQRALEKEKQSVAVMIAGGYHTLHLKKLFRERGFSFAVLTPIVTSETNQRKYEKLLLDPLVKRAATVRAVQGQTRAQRSLAMLDKDLELKKTGDGVRRALVAQLQQEAGAEVPRPAEVERWIAANQSAATYLDLAYRLGIEAERARDGVSLEEAKDRAGVLAAAATAAKSADHRRYLADIPTSALSPAAPAAPAVPAAPAERIDAAEPARQQILPIAAARFSRLSAAAAAALLSLGIGGYLYERAARQPATQEAAAPAVEAPPVPAVPVSPATPGRTSPEQVLRRWTDLSAFPDTAYRELVIGSNGRVPGLEALRNSRLDAASQAKLSEALQIAREVDPELTRQVEEDVRHVVAADIQWHGMAIAAADNTIIVGSSILKERNAKDLVPWLLHEGRHLRKDVLQDNVLEEIQVRIDTMPAMKKLYPSGPDKEGWENMQMEIDQVMKTRAALAKHGIPNANGLFARLITGEDEVQPVLDRMESKIRMAVFYRMARQAVEVAEKDGRGYPLIGEVQRGTVSVNGVEKEGITFNYILDTPEREGHYIILSAEGEVLADSWKQLQDFRKQAPSGRSAGARVASEGAATGVRVRASFIAAENRAVFSLPADAPLSVAGPEGEMDLTRLAEIGGVKVEAGERNTVTVTLPENYDFRTPAGSRKTLRLPLPAGIPAGTTPTVEFQKRSGEAGSPRAGAGKKAPLAFNDMMMDSVLARILARMDGLQAAPAHRAPEDARQLERESFYRRKLAADRNGEETRVAGYVLDAIRAADPDGKNPVLGYVAEQVRRYSPASRKEGERQLFVNALSGSLTGWPAGERARTTLLSLRLARNADSIQEVISKMSASDAALALALMGYMQMIGAQPERPGEGSTEDVVRAYEAEAANRKAVLSALTAHAGAAPVPAVPSPTPADTGSDLFSGLEDAPPRPSAPARPARPAKPPKRAVPAVAPSGRTSRDDVSLPRPAATTRIGKGFVIYSAEKNSFTVQLPKDVPLRVRARDGRLIGVADALSSDKAGVRPSKTPGKLELFLPPGYAFVLTTPAGEVVSPRLLTGIQPALADAFARGERPRARVVLPRGEARDEALERGEKTLSEIPLALAGARLGEREFAEEVVRAVQRLNAAGVTPLDLRDFHDAYYASGVTDASSMGPRFAPVVAALFGSAVPADAAQKEMSYDFFKDALERFLIPPGLTYLVHGTNLSRKDWDGRVGTLDAETFDVRGPLSTITREDGIRSGPAYNTTRTYSIPVPRPDLPAAEYAERSRPATIRVVFFRNYDGYASMTPFWQLVPPAERDRIRAMIKEYYGFQNGRHPAVPANTRLRKLMTVRGAGAEAIHYFIPEPVADVYAERLARERQKPSERPVYATPAVSYDQAERYIATELTPRTSPEFADSVRRAYSGIGLLFGQLPAYVSNPNGAHHEAVKEQLLDALQGAEGTIAVDASQIREIALEAVIAREKSARSFDPSQRWATGEPGEVLAPAGGKPVSQLIVENLRAFLLQPAGADAAWMDRMRRAQREFELLARNRNAEDVRPEDRESVLRLMDRLTQKRLDALFGANRGPGPIPLRYAGQPLTALDSSPMALPRRAAIQALRDGIVFYDPATDSLVPAVPDTENLFRMRAREAGAVVAGARMGSAEVVAAPLRINDVPPETAVVVIGEMTPAFSMARDTSALQDTLSERAGLSAVASATAFVPPSQIELQPGVAFLPQIYGARENSAVFRAAGQYAVIAVIEPTLGGIEASAQDAMRAALRVANTLGGSVAIPVFGSQVPGLEASAAAAITLDALEDALSSGEFPNISSVTIAAGENAEIVQARLGARLSAEEKSAARAIFSDAVTAPEDPALRDRARQLIRSINERAAGDSPLVLDYDNQTVEAMLLSARLHMLADLDVPRAASGVGMDAEEMVRPAALRQVRLWMKAAQTPAFKGEPAYRHDVRRLAAESRELIARLSGRENTVLGSQLSQYFSSMEKYFTEADIPVALPAAPPFRLPEAPRPAPAPTPDARGPVIRNDLHRMERGEIAQFVLQPDAEIEIHSSSVPAGESSYTVSRRPGSRSLYIMDEDNARAGHTSFPITVNPGSSLRLRGGVVVSMDSQENVTISRIGRVPLSFSGTGFSARRIAAPEPVELGETLTVGGNVFRLGLAADGITVGERTYKFNEWFVLSFSREVRTVSDMEGGPRLVTIRGDAANDLWIFVDPAAGESADLGTGPVGRSALGRWIPMRLSAAALQAAQERRRLRELEEALAREDAERRAALEREAYERAMEEAMEAERRDQEAAVRPLRWEDNGVRYTVSVEGPRIFLVDEEGRRVELKDPARRARLFGDPDFQRQAEEKARAQDRLEEVFIDAPVLEEAAPDESLADRSIALSRVVEARGVRSLEAAVEKALSKVNRARVPASREGAPMLISMRADGVNVAVDRTRPFLDQASTVRHLELFTLLVNALLARDFDPAAFEAALERSPLKPIHREATLKNIGRLRAQFGGQTRTFIENLAQTGRLGDYVNQDLYSDFKLQLQDIDGLDFGFDPAGALARYFAAVHVSQTSRDPAEKADAFRELRPHRQYRKIFKGGSVATYDPQLPMGFRFQRETVDFSEVAPFTDASDHYQVFPSDRFADFRQAVEDQAGIDAAKPVQESQFVIFRSALQIPSKGREAQGVRNPFRRFVAVGFRGKIYLVYRSASHSVLADDSQAGQWKRMEAAVVDESTGRVDWIAKPLSENMNEIQPALSRLIQRSIDDGEINLYQAPDEERAESVLTNFVFAVGGIATDSFGNFLRREGKTIVRARRGIQPSHNRYAHIWKDFKDQPDDRNSDEKLQEEEPAGIFDRTYFGEDVFSIAGVQFRFVLEGGLLSFQHTETGRMLRFVAPGGKNVVQSYALQEGEKIVLGRYGDPSDPNSRYRGSDFEKSAVSRKHAEVYVRDGTYYLKPLESRNGTKDADGVEYLPGFEINVDFPGLDGARLAEAAEAAVTRLSEIARGTELSGERFASVRAAVERLAESTAAQDVAAVLDAKDAITAFFRSLPTDDERSLLRDTLMAAFEAADGYLRAALEAEEDRELSVPGGELYLNEDGRIEYHRIQILATAEAALDTTRLRPFLSAAAEASAMDVSADNTPRLKELIAGLEQRWLDAQMEAFRAIRAGDQTRIVLLNGQIAEMRQVLDQLRRRVSGARLGEAEVPRVSYAEVDVFEAALDFADKMDFFSPEFRDPRAQSAYVSALKEALAARPEAMADLWRALSGAIPASEGQKRERLLPLFEHIMLARVLADATLLYMETASPENAAAQQVADAVAAAVRSKARGAHFEFVAPHLVRAAGAAAGRPGVTAALAGILSRWPTQRQLRTAFIAAMAQAGAAAYPPLREVYLAELENERAGVRPALARALQEIYLEAFGLMGEPAALPLLVDAYSVQIDPDVRADLLQSAGHLQTPAATAFLLSALETESGGHSRAAALQSLAETASRGQLAQVSPVLVNEIGSKQADPYHRAAALFALFFLSRRFGTDALGAQTAAAIRSFYDEARATPPVQPERGATVFHAPFESREQLESYITNRDEFVFSAVPAFEEWSFPEHAFEYYVQAHEGVSMNPYDGQGAVPAQGITPETVGLVRSRGFLLVQRGEGDQASIVPLFEKIGQVGHSHPPRGTGAIEAVSEADMRTYDVYRLLMDRVGRALPSGARLEPGEGRAAPPSRERLLEYVTESVKGRADADAIVAAVRQGLSSAADADLRAEAEVPETGIPEQAVERPDGARFADEAGFLNRPKGVRTERPAYDFPRGHKDHALSTQDRIEYGQAREYMDLDAERMRRIAAAETARLGRPVTEADVRKAIVFRMKELIAKAQEEIRLQQNRQDEGLFHRRHAPVDLKSWGFWWRNLLGDAPPAFRIVEKDGQTYERVPSDVARRKNPRFAEAERFRQFINRTKAPGETDIVVEGRYNLYLNPSGGVRRSTDVGLIYKKDGELRFMRFNDIVAELAEAGVFQKGLPEDNPYGDGEKWDQRYVQNPETFWSDLLERPADAERALTLSALFENSPYADFDHSGFALIISTASEAYDRLVAEGASSAEAAESIGRTLAGADGRSIGALLEALAAVRADGGRLPEGVLYRSRFYEDLNFSETLPRRVVTALRMAGVPPASDVGTMVNRFVAEMVDNALKASKPEFGALVNGDKLQYRVLVRVEGEGDARAAVVDVESNLTPTEKQEETIRRKLAMAPEELEAAILAAVMALVEGDADAQFQASGGSNLGLELSRESVRQKHKGADIFYARGPKTVTFSLKLPLAGAGTQGARFSAESLFDYFRKGVDPVNQSRGFNDATSVAYLYREFERLDFALARYSELSGSSAEKRELFARILLDLQLLEKGLRRKPDRTISGGKTAVKNPAYLKAVESMVGTFANVAAILPAGESLPERVRAAREDFILKGVDGLGIPSADALIKIDRAESFAEFRYQNDSARQVLENAEALADYVGAVIRRQELRDPADLDEKDPDMEAIVFFAKESVPSVMTSNVGTGEVALGDVSLVQAVLKKLESALRRYADGDRSAAYVRQMKDLAGTEEGDRLLERRRELVRELREAIDVWRALGAQLDAVTMSSYLTSAERAIDRFAGRVRSGLNELDQRRFDMQSVLLAAKPGSDAAELQAVIARLKDVRRITMNLDQDLARFAADLEEDAAKELGERGRGPGAGPARRDYLTERFGEDVLRDFDGLPARIGDLIAEIDAQITALETRLSGARLVRAEDSPKTAETAAIPVESFAANAPELPRPEVTEPDAVAAALDSEVAAYLPEIPQTGARFPLKIADQPAVVSANARTVRVEDGRGNLIKQKDIVRTAGGQGTRETPAEKIMEQKIQTERVLAQLLAGRGIEFFTAKPTVVAIDLSIILSPETTAYNTDYTGNLLDSLERVKQMPIARNLSFRLKGAQAEAIVQSPRGARLASRGVLTQAPPAGVRTANVASPETVSTLAGETYVPFQRIKVDSNTAGLPNWTAVILVALFAANVDAEALETDPEVFRQFVESYREAMNVPVSTQTELDELLSALKSFVRGATDELALLAARKFAMRAVPIDVNLILNVFRNIRQNVASSA